MVVYERAAPDDVVPYGVTVPSHQPDRSNLIVWLDSNGCGIVRMSVISDPEGGTYQYRFHFSDQDTAFWFRMRFGGK